MSWILFTLMAVFFQTFRNAIQSKLSATVPTLGVTLVERTRRVVRFTPLGERVVDKAHVLLREAEELAELVQSAGKPLSGELRMSVIPTIAPFLLPKILPRLRKERPSLKLFLREEPSADAIESLQHGRADCVLLALPFATGEVDSEILFNDRLFVAFPKDDPRDPPDRPGPPSLADRIDASTVPAVPELVRPWFQTAV